MIPTMINYKDFFASPNVLKKKENGSMSKKTKSKAKTSPVVAKEASKRKYSDSRERVLNNLQKMQSSCKLIRNRFVAWGKAAPDDKAVSKIMAHLETLNETDVTLSEMYDSLHSLLEDFTPPKAVFKTTFEVGDHVTLEPKYKARYEKVYDANFSSLEIESINDEDGHTGYTLTDGNIRFLVPAKAHLVHDKSRDED